MSIQNSKFLPNYLVKFQVKKSLKFCPLLHWIYWIYLKFDHSEIENITWCWCQDGMAKTFALSSFDKDNYFAGDIDKDQTERVAHHDEKHRPNWWCSHCHAQCCLFYGMKWHSRLVLKVQRILWIYCWWLFPCQFWTNLCMSQGPSGKEAQAAKSCHGKCQAWWPKRSSWKRWQKGKKVKRQGLALQ